jgi:hypothetical protein
MSIPYSCHTFIPDDEFRYTNLNKAFIVISDDLPIIDLPSFIKQSAVDASDKLGKCYQQGLIPIQVLRLWLMKYEYQGFQWIVIIILLHIMKITVDDIKNQSLWEGCSQCLLYKNYP